MLNNHSNKGLIEYPVPVVAVSNSSCW